MWIKDRDLDSVPELEQDITALNKQALYDAMFAHSFVYEI